VNEVWRMFWGDLNTPSSFPTDPQGAFLNQLGHIAAGLVAAIVLCYAFLLGFGEMPYRWGVWFAIVAIYLVAIEWFTQGWNKADSVIDGAFVALGAAIPLAGLKEIAFHPKVVLEPRPIEGLAVLVISALALAAYVYPRAVRRWKERGSDGGTG
jgi:membrane-bound ClpP family serine protease